jgi:GNAT superfamily N-acetyltransferase
VTDVRQATVDDADEIVRLRGLMIGALDGAPPEPGLWQEHVRATVVSRIAAPEPSLAVFVVDHPTAPGRLASCAVGTIERRFGGPRDVNGVIGYVFNVVTDPDCQRRGYANACMAGLIEWFGRQGVTRVELKASPFGKALYERMGFTLSHGVAMRLFIG